MAVFKTLCLSPGMVQAMLTATGLVIGKVKFQFANSSIGKHRTQYMILMTTRGAFVTNGAMVKQIARNILQIQRHTLITGMTISMLNSLRINLHKFTHFQMPLTMMETQSQ